jgi:hypothetical protein
MSSNTTRFPHSGRTTSFNSNTCHSNDYPNILLDSNWHRCMLHSSIVAASSSSPALTQRTNIQYYLQKIISIWSLLAILYQFTSTRPQSAPQSDNDQCYFQSIILFPRIPCSSCSPQVHPPRTTPSKKLRDTCRLNSTNARGFPMCREHNFN